MLYKLIFTNVENSCDEYSEDFAIGMFESISQAEDIAQYYLKTLSAFVISIVHIALFQKILKFLQV